MVHVRHKAPATQHRYFQLLFSPLVSINLHLLKRNKSKFLSVSITKCFARAFRSSVVLHTGPEILFAAVSSRFEANDLSVRISRMISNSNTGVITDQG